MLLVFDLRLADVLRVANGNFVVERLCVVESSRCG
jgi:hypothetical protein